MTNFLLQNANFEPPSPPPNHWSWLKHGLKTFLYLLSHGSSCIWQVLCNLCGKNTDRSLVRTLPTLIVPVSRTTCSLFHLSHCIQEVLWCSRMEHSFTFWRELCCPLIACLLLVLTLLVTSIPWPISSWRMEGGGVEEGRGRGEEGRGEEEGGRGEVVRMDGYTSWWKACYSDTPCFEDHVSCSICYPWRFTWKTYLLQVHSHSVVAELKKKKKISMHNPLFLCYLLIRLSPAGRCWILSIKSSVRYATWLCVPEEENINSVNHPVVCTQALPFLKKEEREAVQAEEGGKKGDDNRTEEERRDAIERGDYKGRGGQ